MTEDCRRFDKALVDLCYLELSEELSAPLREHASQCPRCQRELESFVLLRRLTRQLPNLEPSQSIDGKILEAALQQAKEFSTRSVASDLATNREFNFIHQLRRLLRRPAWVLSTAAALLAIGVSIAILGQTDKIPREEEPTQLASRPNDEKFAPHAFPAPGRPTAPAAPSWPQASARTRQPNGTGASPRPKEAPRKALSEASPKASTQEFEKKADNGIAGASTPSQRSFASTHQRLEQALAAYRRGDCDSAESDLEFVASDTHSSSTNAATALHTLARCEKRQRGCSAAISLYRRLLQDFPRYFNRVEALQEAATCHRELGQTRQAQGLQDEIDAAGHKETP